MLNNKLANIITSTLLLIIINNSLFAQLPIIAQSRSTLSPSAERFNSYFQSSELTMYNLLARSTCFYSIEKQTNTDTTKITSAIISTFYSAGKTEGDFLPYEGRSNYDVGLKGFAVKDYDKYGILYGKAHYAVGKHRDISWSAMRFPELYLPYAKTDSTGGDSKFESYYAEGGYTHKLHGLHFGANFSFNGEQAYRLTDPRVLNNTTFLTFKLGVGKVFAKGNSLCISAYYMRNKQYEHDRYWRPGEQQRFFVLYGFGLYNNKQSSVSFGVSRMFYINNEGIDISYQSANDKPISIKANIIYDYKYMYAEESSIITLYESRTHSISPALNISYAINNRIRLKLFTFNQIIKRLGCENILERYMTDVVNSTYDYRKIADEKNYHYFNLNSNTTLRAEYQFNNISKIGIQFGIIAFERKEKNTKYDYLVDNMNVTPTFRIDADFLSPNSKHQLNLALQYNKQVSVKNKYNVDIQNNSIPHLDFQTCFTPYAYHSAEFDALCSQAVYTYHFSKFSLGVKADAFLTSGTRLNDVEYNKTIGFNSICPMILPHADKHNEKWFSISTFILF